MTIVKPDDAVLLSELRENMKYLQHVIASPKLNH